MAVIKCKMCGGDLVIEPGSTVAECEYCGSRQTVPSADNEKKLALFARANRLRAACEFDKAAGIYESIVADFPEEAEAYWGLVLCKYGIEYVDDSATGKKIPTCHRSSFDSVMEDSDLEQTLENADAIARKVYREEAKQIEELRKGIIEVSGKEQPYDIFICYKETGENGERTIDSVIAQDVYDALTSKGYRVFFSRITLEDKLGQEYEPYIFAALNSAKIMLAFGTDYEYYNAVWVKNEWSRYLKLMASDKSKHLIPCYKGIDAYDMPKEFARLQAQDMGKVGAMQDLLRGIDKLIAAKPAVSQTPGVQTDDVNRIYIYNSALEDMKSKKVKRVKDAVKKLSSLGDWNDVPQQLEKAKKHLKKRKSVRTTRRIIIWGIVLAILCTIAGTIWNGFKGKYETGMKYMQSGQYARAIRPFENASIYRKDGVTAQDMAAEAKRLAALTEEKLRALLGEDENAAVFYGDEWLRQAVEESSVCECEVMVNEGNGYNGYMEGLNADFYLANEHGQITYQADTDEYQYTSDDGDIRKIWVEDDALYLEDGRMYYGSLTAIDWLFTEIQNMAGSEKSDAAAETMLLMYFSMMESGLITNEQTRAACVERFVTNMERLMENINEDDLVIIGVLNELSEVASTNNAVAENPDLLMRVEALRDACDTLMR